MLLCPPCEGCVPSGYKAWFAAAESGPQVGSAAQSTTKSHFPSPGKRRRAASAAARLTLKIISLRGLCVLIPSCTILREDLIASWKVAKYPANAASHAEVSVERRSFCPA